VALEKQDAQPLPFAYDVFTAVDAGGLSQLEIEAAHYASVPSYAAHFRRADIDAIDAAVHATTVGGAAVARVRCGASRDGRPRGRSRRRRRRLASVLDAAAPPR
jgi:hypothetical protein